jgi:UDP-2-acetamido-2,6-beta-L-arabino-hexul-4-ose reductase
VSEFRIERLDAKRDPRGFVFEPLENGTLGRFQNVHAALTRPGCVRGNHYHPHALEILTFVGPALALVLDGDDLHEIDVADGEVVRLTLPPGTAHAVRNTGDRDALMVAFSTVAHEGAGSDVVRVQLLD